MTIINDEIRYVVKNAAECKTLESAVATFFDNVCVSGETPFRVSRNDGGIIIEPVLQGHINQISLLNDVGANVRVTYMNAEGAGLKIADVNYSVSYKPVKQ